MTEKKQRNLNALPGEASFHKSLVRAGFNVRDQSRIMTRFRTTQLLQLANPRPLDMVLHCPNCSQQHIDKPDCVFDHFDVPMEPDSDEGKAQIAQMQAWEREHNWSNPPHRSHLCGVCGFIWRPADVPTNGVAATKTKGKDDTQARPIDAPIASPVMAPLGAAQVPAGWKLVPVEITEPMHVAAVKTIIRCTGNDDFPPRVYRAMLAAAPEPTAGAAQVPSQPEAPSADH